MLVEIEIRLKLWLIVIVDEDGFLNTFLVHSRKEEEEKEDRLVIV